MKKVFRSIINIRKDGRPTIETEELKHNYRAFLASHVEPEDPAYITLYHWIESHFRQFDDLPDILLLNERATSEGKEGVIACLIEIAQQTPYIGSDYRSVLKSKHEEQSKDKFKGALEKAWQIVSNGLKVGKSKKELKGIADAVEYITTTARTLRTSNPVKTESNIRSVQDAEEVRKEYETMKKDPSSAIGMYTFLEKIDGVCRGSRPGDLILIAGFTSNGKSVLVSNFAYSGIMQGLNGVFITSEMSFEEMRRMFYVLHTSSPEWVDHPKFGKLVGKITYDKVMYAELTDTEEEYWNAVTKDFGENPHYGQLFMHQADHVTPSGLETILYDYNARLAEEGKTLDFVVHDYIGLMAPDKDERYGDRNEDLNAIIVRLKNLAMEFDHGRRIRIISPFQINRQGWIEAGKNDGVYKLNALSSAHMAERTPDLVIGIYSTPEMRQSGIAHLCCMKHRRGAQFPSHDIKINFASKYASDFIQAKNEPDMVTSDIPVET